MIGARVTTPLEQTQSAGGHAAEHRPRYALRTLRRDWRLDGLALAPMWVFIVASIALDLAGILPGFMTRYYGNAYYYLAAPAAILAAVGVMAWWGLRPWREGGKIQPVFLAWPRISPADRHRIIDWQLVCRVLLYGLTLPLLWNTYASWKTLIPVLQPFYLDESLARLDQVIHLGRQPWEWLWPLLGNDFATRVLDRIYFSWIYLIPVVVLLLAFQRDPVTRSRFFLTYALTLILAGSLAAVALSSAGPCYYPLVADGPDPFGKLMEGLRSVDSRTGLRALDIQSWLWQSHLARGPVAYARISAMPSIHVGLTFLYALVAMRAGWVLAALGWSYFALIMIGSVHLGWHYAVDGYLGVLAVVVAWTFAGWLLKRAQRFSTIARADRE